MRSNPIAIADQCVGLVLDDYHLIQSQEIHDPRIDLLDNLPQYIRLVIATRTGPALRLAHLRARGKLCEIRANDLRFTIEEAMGFLNQSIKMDLSTSDVVKLTKKTKVGLLAFNWLQSL